MLEDDTFWLIKQWNLLRNRCVILRQHFQYLALHISHVLFLRIDKNGGPLTVLFLFWGFWFSDGNQGPAPQPSQLNFVLVHNFPSDHCASPPA